MPYVLSPFDAASTDWRRLVGRLIVKWTKAAGAPLISLRRRPWPCNSR
ncbi:hypothetical protein [Asticcacaulis sp. EMRT-3]|nr:hypothetical protein [Asticcacaulis sp. EMRT-3]MDI7775639.1 hypothetical protein [Asticcacaulis sp. EMRT-3]